MCMCTCRHFLGMCKGGGSAVCACSVGVSVPVQRYVYVV